MAAWQAEALFISFYAVCFAFCVTLYVTLYVVLMLRYAMVRHVTIWNALRTRELHITRCMFYVAYVFTSSPCACTAFHRIAASHPLRLHACIVKSALRCILSVRSHVCLAPLTRPRDSRFFVFLEY